MTKTEAIALVCSIAEQWVENAEEGFVSRINPAIDTDEVLRDKATHPDGTFDEYEFDQMKTCRDFWIALGVIYPNPDGPQAA